MSTKLDILAFGAHPDDVELACSGTILKHVEKGYNVGVVDLTQGELGSRGSAKLRLEEAANSSKILGLAIRDNLALRDGFFEVNEESLIRVIRKIREYQPNVIFCNAISDRHPDHGQGSELVSRASYLSGLRKINTDQETWRPKAVYHYIQDRYIKPDFVVDITSQWKYKMDSILSFSSQFYSGDSTEPETPISGKDFLQFVEARARQFGREIGVEYAEGFTIERSIGVEDITKLF